MSLFKKQKGKPLKTAANNEKDMKPLFPSLEDNIGYICGAFYHTDDLQVRKVTFRGKQGKLVYLETMTDTKAIQQNLLNPLTEADESQHLKDLITSVDFNISNSLDEVVSALLIGSSALLFEGGTKLFLFKTPQVTVRTPDEPENEKVVRGSHQGFVEKLNVNMNLIRQRIQNRQLTVKYYELGRESNTNIAIVYMNQLADPSLVEKVENRIKSISSDMIFAPGYIEEFIEDNPLSPFPQILYTERPDRLEAHLMEGRVAIMSQGSSEAIIMPVTFFPFFRHRMISISDFT